MKPVQEKILEKLSQIPETQLGISLEIRSQIKRLGEKTKNQALNILGFVDYTVSVLIINIYLCDN